MATAFIQGFTPDQIDVIRRAFVQFASPADLQQAERVGEAAETNSRKTSLAHAIAHAYAEEDFLIKWATRNGLINPPPVAPPIEGVQAAISAIAELQRERAKVRTTRLFERGVKCGLEMSAFALSNLFDKMVDSARTKR